MTTKKKTNYQILRTKKQVEDLVCLLVRSGKFVVDLETTGLDTFMSHLQIVGIGFCFKANEAYYIPTNLLELNTELNTDNPTGALLDILRPVLEDPGLGKIGQNIKYDCRVFRKYGLRVNGIVFDTMLASYCLFSDKVKHSLDDMSMYHLGHIKIRTKTLIPSRKSKKGEPKLTMMDAPVDQVGIYCMEDVDYTFQLYRYFEYLLNLPSYAAAKKLFEKIELPLYPVIIDMECQGVKVDTNVTSSIKEEVVTILSSLKKQVCETAGWEVSVTKPVDIAKLIYDDLKLFEKRNIPIRFTKTKKRATDQKVLSLVQDDPTVEKILVIKKMNKLLSTYVDGIPREISDITGRVHTSFNQCVTSTGRLSSDSPNLQNIPIRTEIGKKLRGAFVSSFDSGQLLSADYSQQELRILAHMSGEPVLIETYKNNQDAHIRTAAMIYKVAEEAVTKKQRDYCKTINYGIIYGMQAKKLSEELGIPENEAEQLLHEYLKNMTHVASYLESTKRFLEKHGYTETMYGRRRYLPGVYSFLRFTKYDAYREGMNHTVQGSGADQVKMAMIKIASFLSDKESKLVMQVHDEVVCDMHPGELHLAKDIKLIMETIDPNLRVPLIADAKLGKSWMDAH